MKQYLSNGINNTPTLAAPAAVKMDECRGKAVKFDAEGNIVLCDTAGEKVLGIVTIDNDVIVEQGDNVSVQIKDNGVAVAGGEVAIGDELATDANGKFVTAAAGQYVRAIALEAGVADRIIPVMMANYVSAGASAKK